MTVRTFLPRLLFLTTLASFGVGCATVVDQNAKTGKDGKLSKSGKGAKKIKVDPDERFGKARDIVTYPGGDRTDWKYFELTQPANVTVTLKWTPPRKGQDLSFTVYDEWNTPVDGGKAKPAKGSGKTKKSVTLENLWPGKFFVEIYATSRDDAGDYTVEVEYEDAEAAVATSDTGNEDDGIPNPPKLPAMPPPPEEGGGGGGGPDCVKTPDLPACMKDCPAGPAAPTCKAGPQNCVEATPPPLNVTCTPKKCKKKFHWDIDNTMCVEDAVINVGKIMQFETKDKQLIVIIDKGEKKGVKVGFKGVLLDGNSSDPTGDIEFEVISVTSGECRATAGKIKQSALGDNRRVRLFDPEQGDVQ